MKKFLLALSLFLWNEAGFAMDLEPITMTLWAKGETIAAEEFVAMNEEIVDYIASLKRPTDPTKTIKYSCMTKKRQIRPSLQKVGPSGLPDYVRLVALYQLQDCKAIN